MNKITQTLIIAVFASLLAVSGAAQQEQLQENSSQQTNQSITNGSDAIIQRPGALPGSFSYKIVRLQETVELAFANAPIIGSQDRVAMVRANHAQRRVAEALALIRNNRTEEAQGLLEEYEQNLQKASEAAQKANNTEINERINQAKGNQIQAIEQAMKNAPEQAQQGLQRAMENARRAGPPEHAGPPKDAGPNNRSNNQRGPPADAGPGNNQETENDSEDLEPSIPENETGQDNDSEPEEDKLDDDQSETDLGNGSAAENRPAN